VEVYYKILEDVTKHENFQVLASLFQARNIDWFIEETRPSASEKLQRERAGKQQQLQLDKEDLQNTIKELEKNMKLAEASVENLKDREVMHEYYQVAADLHHLQREHERRLNDEQILEQQLTVARTAQEWLDQPRREVAPLGMSQEMWLDACGGEGFVIPPTRIVPRADVETPAVDDSLKISLFPSHEARAPKAITQPRFSIKITEISACDIRSPDFRVPQHLGDQGSVYCSCMPLNRLGSGFTTTVANDPRTPVWKCSEFIKDYISGDSLVFKLYDRQSGRDPDVLVAEAELPAKEFLPHGFHGKFRLFTSSHTPMGWLRVAINVHYV